MCGERPCLMAVAVGGVGCPCALREVGALRLGRSAVGGGPYGK